MGSYCQSWWSLEGCNVPNWSNFPIGFNHHNLNNVLIWEDWGFQLLCFQCKKVCFNLSHIYLWGSASHLHSMASQKEFLNVFFCGIFSLGWWFNPCHSAIVTALLSSWNYWRTKWEVILFTSHSSDVMGFQPCPNTAHYPSTFDSEGELCCSCLTLVLLYIFLAQREVWAKGRIMCSFCTNRI